MARLGLPRLGPGSVRRRSSATGRTAPPRSSCSRPTPKPPPPAPPSSENPDRLRSVPLGVTVVVMDHASANQRHKAARITGYLLAVDSDLPPARRRPNHEIAATAL